MKKKLPLTVAGIVFTLVAIGHVLRLYKAVVIVVGGTILPMSVSIVGLIISVLLAIWMFVAACSCKSKSTDK